MFHFYYYKIYNDLNNNLYIGITQNAGNRKKQHFSKLDNNNHPNPHLQSAYNKYGKNHFHFEIIEEKDYEELIDGYLYEAELIKKYDSFNNGYNCNPGGTWTGPRGKFTEEQIYFIKSALYYNEKVTGVLANYYNCATATIENIRIDRNYKQYCVAFNKMPEEEKLQWYEDFCEESNFEIIKYQKNRKKESRKYSKEQVFIILRWSETKFTTAKKLCDLFDIDYPKSPNYKCANKFREIREGKTYIDYIKEYNNLTESEKQKYERLYTEMCIEKSL